MLLSTLLLFLSACRTHGSLARSSKLVELPRDAIKQEYFQEGSTLSRYNLPIIMPEFLGVSPSGGRVFLKLATDLYTLDASGLTAMGHTTTAEVATCGGVTAVSDVNFGRTFALRPPCNQPEVPAAALDSGVTFADTAGGTASNVCKLSACVNSTLVTSAAGCFVDDSGTTVCGLRDYLVTLDLATGQRNTLRSSNGPGISTACNTNFGDLRQAVGSKVVFTDCCMVEALDPTTAEVRHVRSICNCSEVECSYALGGAPDCKVPTLRVAVDGHGFIMSENDLSADGFVAVVSGDDGWPVAHDLDMLKDMVVTARDTASWLNSDPTVWILTGNDHNPTYINSGPSYRRVMRWRAERGGGGTVGNVTNLPVDRFVLPRRYFGAKKLAVDNNEVFAASRDPVDPMRALLYTSPAWYTDPHGDMRLLGNYTPVPPDGNVSRFAGRYVDMGNLEAMSDFVFAIVQVYQPGYWVNDVEDPEYVEAVAFDRYTGAARKLTTICDKAVTGFCIVQGPRTLYAQRNGDSVLHLVVTSNSTMEVWGVTAGGAPFQFPVCADTADGSFSRTDSTSTSASPSSSTIRDDDNHRVQQGSSSSASALGTLTIMYLALVVVDV